MTKGKSDSYWPGADERSIVEEMIRDRESQHWEACSEFVKRRVYAKAKNIPNNYRDEISQEAMCKIAKSLPTFQFQCALKTWLIPIIEHCIIDMHRKLRILGPFSVPLGDPLNENDREGEVIAVSEARSAEDMTMINAELRNAVAALVEYANSHSHPTRDWLIIQLAIFEGRTHQEIAKIVGCNAPVVGYVVREAQRYVREKMGPKS
jgi:RNA polymerase sigma factor (sigma-70 family)